MMAEKRKSIDELLQRMSENNKKAGIQKLDSDEQGRLLLDPNNKHHVAWYQNDDAYEDTPDE